MKAHYSEGFGSDVLVLHAKKQEEPITGVFVLDPLTDDIALKAMVCYAKHLTSDDPDYIALINVLDRIGEQRKDMEDSEKWKQ